MRACAWSSFIALLVNVAPSNALAAPVAAC